MKPKINITVVLLIVAAVLLMRYIYYYPGGYSREKTLAPDFIYPVTELSAAPKQETSAGEAGVVLVDRAHDNRFTLEELNLFVRQIQAQGGQIRYLNDSRYLSNMLRQAQGFLVISPRAGYTEYENKILEEFTGKGGRILILADPDRESRANSLAKSYGLTFLPGFLFNMAVNDGNFKYILADPTKYYTGKAGKVALYSSCPIEGGGSPLFQTMSGSSYSLTNMPIDASPAVSHGNVVALCDHSFMFTEEYSMRWDNRQLISDLAGFLSRREKALTLSDFPFIFEDDVEFIGLVNTTYQHYIRLRGILKYSGLKSVKGGSYPETQSTFYLLMPDAVQRQARQVADAGIWVANNTVYVGDYQMDIYSSTIVYYNRQKDRQRLFILSPTEKTLADAIDLLSEGKIGRYLLDENLAYIMEDVQADSEPVLDGN